MDTTQDEIRISLATLSERGRVLRPDHCTVALRLTLHERARPRRVQVAVPGTRAAVLAYAFTGGTTRVTFDGRTVEYRSLDELGRALSVLHAA